MIELTASLLLFLFPLAYSPGPGNLFFASMGASFGSKSTIAASAGYHIATMLITIGIGFGFLEILSRFPQIFPIITVLGSLYVFWLAWNIVNSDVAKESDKAKASGFWSGVILLLFNPKAYFIIAAMFTQFLQGETSHQVYLILWISTVFTLNNLLAFTLWTVAGDRIGALFRSEASAKIVNSMLGLVLAMVATWMLVS